MIPSRQRKTFCVSRANIRRQPISSQRQSDTKDAWKPRVFGRIEGTSSQTAAKDCIRTISVDPIRRLFNIDNKNVMRAWNLLANEVSIWIGPWISPLTGLDTCMPRYLHAHCPPRSAAPKPLQPTASFASFAASKTASKVTKLTQVRFACDCRTLFFELQQDNWKMIVRVGLELRRKSEQVTTTNTNLPPWN